MFKNITAVQFEKTNNKTFKKAGCELEFWYSLSRFLKEHPWRVITITPSKSASGWSTFRQVLGCSISVKLKVALCHLFGLVGDHCGLICPLIWALGRHFAE